MFYSEVFHVLLHERILSRMPERVPYSPGARDGLFHPISLRRFDPLKLLYMC